MIAWIDLETTGLSLDCSIIEIACVITENNFDIRVGSFGNLERFHSLVKLPENAVIEQGALQMHQKTGLWDEVYWDAKMPIDLVDNQVAAFFTRHFITEKLVLAGSSVHFDRNFIEKWMPKTSEKLHYRNLDMSSIKQFVHFAYNIPLESLPGRKVESKHRAMDDINVSIDAAKWYKDFLTPEIYPWEHFELPTGKVFFSNGVSVV